MMTQSTAKHPKIEKMVIEGYRWMTGAQKLALVGALNRFAQTVELAKIKHDIPTLTNGNCGCGGRHVTCLLNRCGAPSIGTRTRKNSDSWKG